MMKRILLLILTLALCLPLAACAGSGQDKVTENGGSEDSTTAPEPEVVDQPVKLVDSGKAVYNKIIYPEEPGEAIFLAVRSFAADLEDATGVKFEIGTDLKPAWKEYDSETYEILVGITGYKETKSVLSDLRASDYAIVKVGNKIVITAHNESLLLRAISYFRKNLIGNNIVTEDDGTKSLMFTEYKYLKDPAINSLKINGTELKKFRIVYASGADSYKNAAEKFKTVISERYGYMLDISPDSEDVAPGPEFLIGPTNREDSKTFADAHPTDVMEFAMGVQGNNFVVSGKPYSCIQAASKFTTKYLYSDEKDISLATGEYCFGQLLTKTDVPLTDGADIRVMTANILAEFLSWSNTYVITPVAERIEIFTALLNVYHPDIIGIQEVTPAWDRYIPKYLGDRYEFVHMKQPNGVDNYSTMLYDKTKYKVVDSGVTVYSNEPNSNIRLVTWAVFEDLKDPDRRFALFNTHWCWDTAEHAHQQAYEESVVIKRVIDKYKCPYFCTADYNTKQETENYNYFLELTGAVDAKYVARDSGTLLNVAGGCGDLGQVRGNSGNSIDHIFMTKGLGVAAFETVLINNTWDLSDHSPKYADIILNLNK